MAHSGGVPLGRRRLERSVCHRTPCLNFFQPGKLPAAADAQQQVIAAPVESVHGAEEGLGIDVLRLAAFATGMQQRVARLLGEEEMARPRCTELGVWLNFLLELVALALTVHFVTSG